MASKMDDFLEFILILGGIFVGAKFLEEQLTPKVPCPRCRAPVKRGSPICPGCHCNLSWVTK